MITLYGSNWSSKLDNKICYVCNHVVPQLGEGGSILPTRGGFSQ